MPKLRSPSCKHFRYRTESFRNISFTSPDPLKTIVLRRRRFPTKGCVLRSWEHHSTEVPFCELHFSLCRRAVSQKVRLQFRLKQNPVPGDTVDFISVPPGTELCHKIPSRRRPVCRSGVTSSVPEPWPCVFSRTPLQWFRVRSFRHLILDPSFQLSKRYSETPARKLHIPYLEGG